MGTVPLQHPPTPLPYPPHYPLHYLYHTSPLTLPRLPITFSHYLPPSTPLSLDPPLSPLPSPLHLVEIPITFNGVGYLIPSPTPPITSPVPLPYLRPPF